MILLQKLKQIISKYLYDFLSLKYFYFLQPWISLIQLHLTKFWVMLYFHFLAINKSINLAVFPSVFKYVYLYFRVVFWNDSTFCIHFYFWNEMMEKLNLWRTFSSTWFGTISPITKIKIPQLFDVEMLQTIKIYL